MGAEQTASLKGQFLMAMPGLVDPNFYKTVTCICEHTPAGAVGIVIDRQHPILKKKDVFEELKMDYVPDEGIGPIHVGGPVHINEIFVLHGEPFNWKGCLMVTPTLALSNTRDILEAIARGEGPTQSIVFLGCAGWGEGQLESEIKANAWLTCPVSEAIIFETPVERRWEEAIKMMGIDPVLISDSAGHA